MAFVKEVINKLNCKDMGGFKGGTAWWPLSVAISEGGSSGK